MSRLDGTLIIATGPHGWGGAVQALCRALESFAELGASVAYVALEKPYPLRDKNSPIQYVPVSLLESAAVGYSTAPVVDQYVLMPELLAQKMVETAYALDHERLILWGNYVFPFMSSSSRAYMILEAAGIEAELWLSPHGSDIWDIGKRLKDVVHSLLSDTRVSHVIAPSQAFAEEIQRDYGVNREIQPIYPMVDMKRFRPPSHEERMAARAALGFPESAFVISNHSNMRPVKRAEDVLEIAAAVAAGYEGQTILMMVGPQREDLLQLAQTHYPHLDLRWIGVVDDVENYLFATDIELNCSWHDSFNLSLAEAMACAVPCVSTDVVGVGKEILAAEAGFLFPYLPFENAPSNRYAQAVAYLLELAQNQDLRLAMGKRGALHASNVLSQVRLREQYLALLGSKIKIQV